MDKMSSDNWNDREQIPYWVKYRGTIPKTALIGGVQDGEVLYIGRVLHNAAITPGKILQSEKACFISWGYKEYKKNNKFEILIGAEGCWVTALGNKVPENAFCAGNSEQGESLNVGRAKHENSIIVGKIHRRYNLCYLPYKGKEIEVTDFEVLVV